MTLHSGLVDNAAAFCKQNFRENSCPTLLSEQLERNQKQV